jgi:GTP cyclohydrolase I
MAKAVKDFLRAAGLEVVGNPQLARTPERVADAWAQEFLSGYAATPKEALGERYVLPRPGDAELVVATNLTFRSMCPHHLLPYSGRVHVAYAPTDEIVGFGRLAALVDVFAHRLILQEELASRVASSLMAELNAQGAACVIEAEQTCFRLRGENQHEAVTHSEAYEGILRHPAIRGEFWMRLGKRS